MDAAIECSVRIDASRSGAACIADRAKVRGGSAVVRASSGGPSATFLVVPSGPVETGDSSDDLG